MCVKLKGNLIGEQMRINAKWLKIILLAGAVSSLTACGNKEANVETKVYTLDIDGNRSYYDENSEECAAIKTVSEGFLEAAVKKDYNSPDTMSEQEYYIQSVKEANLANNVPELTKQSIVANELVISVNETSLNSIRFAKAGGKERCLANYTYMSTIEHATDAYFERIQLEKNVPYNRTIELEMEKEEGNWKVVGYTLGKREKA